MSILDLECLQPVSDDSGVAVGRPRLEQQAAKWWVRKVFEFCFLK